MELYQSDDVIISGYSSQAEESLVLITGMSGSGRNTVASVLEEMGWYVAGSLPSELTMRTVGLSSEANSPVERLAIITDVRSRVFASSLGEVLGGLRNEGCQPYVILSDANDDTLIAHYDPVRYIHPLQEDGTLSQGITAKRQMLLPIKGMSDPVVDTSDMSVHDLRRELEHQLSDTTSKIQQITIESFGSKHGIPYDTDTFLDVHFLPNPYWVPEPCVDRGTSEAVADCILSQPESQGSSDNVINLIELVLPGYHREDKDFVAIAVRCTRGHHRGMAIPEALVKKFEGIPGVNVNVIYRDIDCNQQFSWRCRN